MKLWHVLISMAPALFVLAACSDDSHDLGGEGGSAGATTEAGTGGTGGAQGGSGGTSQGGTAGSGPAGSGGTAGSGPAGSGGVAGTAGVAGVAGSGGGCPPQPVHSNDCSKVTLFQCGLGLTCEGNKIKASWHEHWMCGTPEQIIPFSCTYDCPVDCDETFVGWPKDGADLVAQMCLSGDGGVAGAAGSAGAAGAGGSTQDGGAICPPLPTYPEDCEQVSNFQCGFSASCNGTTAKVDWHEHYFCNGKEEIYSFTCTHACATSCDSSYSDWPASGALFVQGICK